MKILYITNIFPNSPKDPRGRFIYESIKAVKAEGNEVNVFVTNTIKPKIIPDLIKRNNHFYINKNLFDSEIIIESGNYLSIPRNFYKSISIFFYRKMLLPKIKDHIIKFEPRVIHCHDNLSAFIILPFAKKLDIPVCLTIHGIDTSKQLKNKYMRSINKKIYDQVDSIFVVGKTIIQDIRCKNILENQKKIFFIPNGIKKIRNKKRKTIDLDSLKFISVSNLEEGKGIDLNIKALSLFNKKYPSYNWTYKIIGDGSQKNNIKNLIKKERLQNKITIKGLCNEDEVFKNLVNSDVFILPSYREAFGIAYLEAMSHGLITMGVSNQGPSHFIKDNVTGFLVKPNSYKAIEKFILFVKNNMLDARKIAERGSIYVQKNFTWNIHAQKLIKHYEDLIK